MADWVNISDAQVDPDAPITSELGYAFRDNPIAIAEGATGAPRIADAAMGSTVTNAGSTWVYNRLINRNVGGIGTIIFALAGGISETWSINDTVSGASLTPSSVGQSGSGSMAGTWRCCGWAQASGVPAGANITLWQRVS